MDRRAKAAADSELPDDDREVRDDVGADAIDFLLFEGASGDTATPRISAGGVTPEQQGTGLGVWPNRFGSCSSDITCTVIVAVRGWAGNRAGVARRI